MLDTILWITAAVSLIMVFYLSKQKRQTEDGGALMKDYLRDYATAAFRFYAKNGKSAEQYKKRIYEEALETIRQQEGYSGISKPTEAAIMRAEKAVNEKIAEILDMEAVEKVIAELNCTRRTYVVDVIEYVYFTNSNEELNLGDIQDRVRNAALKVPASERTIYRWLREARELFSYHRGLRL